jgi:CPA2 family monovalent cation:H+ antiporter-2
MNVPYVSIVFDPDMVRKRQLKGETVIYGDAINEPILHLAHIQSAKIIVVSIGNVITASAIIEKVRHLNKHAFILVRTKYVTDIEKLYSLGANEVVPEEFETAIDLFKIVLEQLIVSQHEINKIVTKIRADHYGIFQDKEVKQDTLALKGLPNIEIVAYTIVSPSPIIEKSIAEVQFRKTYKVNLVAILRNDVLMENPRVSTVFQDGDTLYFIGKSDQVNNAVEMLSTSR